MAAVAFTHTTDPSFAMPGTPPTHTRERYVLDVDATSSTITVHYSHDDGRRWGEAHAQRLIAEGPLHNITIDQYPRFVMRGLIEGFYGTSWSQDQRLDMIDFLGAHRMNTYVYSPKADPLCRRQWRSQPSPAQLGELADLVEQGTANGVAVCYGLGPGGSICYSDDRDVEMLLDRYRCLADAGFRHFQLQLDDISTHLHHRADQTRYAGLADAHLDLIAKVRSGLDRIDPTLHLAVCPTVYCGRGDEPYLAALGRAVDPRVDLMWTGPAVWSAQLDLINAATFVRTTSRPVLYWDNYPANDLSMSSELHLGPYRGRDPHLYRFSTGVLVNPMSLPESSKIPLATIADFLWDPTTYDPQLSWDAATLEAAGPAAAALRLFADNVRTSPIEPAESPLLEAALQNLEFHAGRGDPHQARTALTGLLSEFITAAEILQSDTLTNNALRNEIAPWVRVFESTARTMLAGKAPPECERLPMAPKVFGDIPTMFFAESSDDDPDGVRRRGQMGSRGVDEGR